MHDAERFIAAQTLVNPKVQEKIQRSLLVLVGVGKGNDVQVLREEPVITPPDQFQKQPRLVIAPALGNCLECGASQASGFRNRLSFSLPAGGPRLLPELDVGGHFIRIARVRRSESSNECGPA